jgi:Flp pilus assembly protein TadG
MMFLGMVEFSEAFTARRKVGIATSTMADLVSQTESVTTASLNDIVSVSNSIMAPYPAAPLSITITSVGLDSNGNSVALWSCAWATVAAAPNCASTGAAFVLPPGLLVQPTDTVIVVQTSYNFKPPVGQFLLGGLTFSQAAYFKPRLTAAITKP